MGLDISHDAWHGAYSSFNSWRKFIASKIGMNLEDMEGFGGKISFQNFKDHPLVPLLNHSDCDGEIDWKFCKEISDKLFEIANSMNDEFDPNLFKLKTIEFAKGALSAFNSKDNLNFH